MKILLTGATGFLGRALAARLAADGHSLRALTRNIQATQGRLPAGCAAFAWPEGGPVPPAALDGVEGVAHLAGENIGAWPWTASRKRRALASRVDGTRALVDAMGRMQARPRVFVSASAIGFYGDCGDRLMAEDAPAGSGFLAGVCKAWEAEAAKADALGVRTVSVRIGLVLGRGGALEKLAPAFRLGGGTVFGSGRQWWSWINVEDVAGIFAHALATDSLSGPVNGAAPNPVPQRDFARALARAVHRPLLWRVPAFALRLGLGEMAGTLLEGQRADGAKLAGSGYRFRYPALDDALRAALRPPAA